MTRLVVEAPRGTCWQAARRARWVKAGVNYLRSCSSLVSCPIKVILVDLRGAAQSQAQLVVRHHIFTLLRIGVLQSIVRPEGYVSGLWLYDTLVEMY
jgi:hypothetical protein